MLMLNRAAALMASCWLTACNTKECHNTNAIFDRNSPDSEVYKRELASKLRVVDRSELSFWFDHYCRVGEQDYIYVHVTGKELCATAVVAVYDWQGLKDMQRTSGMGYSGAELSGLKIKVLKEGEFTRLVYDGVGGIGD